MSNTTTAQKLAASDLDPSFGEAGIKPITDPENPALNLTIFSCGINAEDQKIYVSCDSSSYPHSRTPYIVRLLPDGQIDTTFGLNGYASPPLGDPQKHQSLLTGTFVFGTNGDVTCMGSVTTLDFQHVYIGATRLTASGSVDTAFGDNGFEVYWLPSSHQIDSAEKLRNIQSDTTFRSMSEAYTTRGVTRQADGKILFLALLMDRPHTAAYLARIDTNGKLDTSFGPNGNGLVPIEDAATLPPYAMQYWTYSVDRTGGLTIMGTQTHDTNQTTKAVVFRYDANGTLDATFNGSGVVFIEDGTADYSGVDVKTLDDGAVIILLNHRTRSPLDHRTQVVKLLATGERDQAFNGGKPVTIDFPLFSYYAYSLILDESKRIITSGNKVEKKSGVNEIIMGCQARLLPNGALDSNFGEQGTASYEKFTELVANIVQNRKDILAIGQYRSGAKAAHVIGKFIG